MRQRAESGKNDDPDFGLLASNALSAINAEVQKMTPKKATEEKKKGSSRSTGPVEACVIGDQVENSTATSVNSQQENQEEIQPNQSLDVSKSDDALKTSTPKMHEYEDMIETLKKRLNKEMSSWQQDTDGFKQPNEQEKQFLVTLMQEIEKQIGPFSPYNPTKHKFDKSAIDAKATKFIRYDMPKSCNVSEYFAVMTENALSGSFFKSVDLGLNGYVDVQSNEFTIRALVHYVLNKDKIDQESINRPCTKDSWETVKQSILYM